MTAYAKKIFFLSCVVILCIAVGSFNAKAEFYKWVDEKGVVHFSDTPPANKKVEVIPEIPVEKIGGTEQIPVLLTEASQTESAHEDQIKKNEQEIKKDQKQLVNNTVKKEKTDKKTRKINSNSVGTGDAQKKNKVDFKPYKKACTRCR